MSQETFTNRLAQEKSPYLLQHAHNPVDWYPWGDEAFEKARREDKPIFLSIGYSTCHWCHVMEEESFTNPGIAKILNDHFISIKVDREERPDVDHIYMQAVMAMTGSGGWPMTVFLTHERTPFYGGTYFPPEDRWGRPGFKTLLGAIQEKWVNERDRLVKSGEEFAQHIGEETRAKSAQAQELDESVLQRAYEQFDSRFDSARGGFGDAPKFPQSHGLSFLLRYGKRVREPNAAHMVEKTLTKMAQGGIYDQLQGGFHRYSTDSEWRVPHFEKMLYDQAILSKSYLEAYQATQNETYARVAREIFDYVLRDLTGPEGGFYSAEDADSAPDPAKPKEKKEGAFYVWSSQEITALLGREWAEIFNFYFGVEAKGNAIHDPQGELEGKNVLYVAHDLEETAQKFKKNTDEIEEIINESKKILTAERAKRVRPHLDDKTLVDWNGLMISSLAFGSRVLNEPRYGEAAKKSADFILAQMKTKDGRLMHRYRDGEVAVKGFLEDYAFFIHGLIDLYEATFDARYLEEAKFLTTEMIRLFADDQDGGFFFSGSDAEQLIARAKEGHDGAIPSGNSVAVLDLLRLGRLMMDQTLEARGRKTMNAFSNQLVRYPSGFSQMLIGLDFALGPGREIVIADFAGDENTGQMVREIYAAFLPVKVVLFHPSEGKETKRIQTLAPFIEHQTALGGKTTVYVCQNYVCHLPVKDVNGLKLLLER